MGQRIFPIGYAEDRFFEKCDIYIFCETLHSKSVYNFSLVIIKLAEIAGEEQVELFLDEKIRLENDEVMKSLFVKYRHCVTKSISAKTRITRVLGCIFWFKGNLKYVRTQRVAPLRPIDARPSYSMAIMD